MKSSLALTLLASASAFAPATVQTRLSTKIAAEDPLWGGEPTPKDGSTEKSKALPFAARPKLLDGTLAGDVGFDPFGFAGSDKASLAYMREAEIKHGRLAMLAVVGWVAAEILDKPIADVAGLPTALTKSGASPSLLNGGLDKIDVTYWVIVASLAGLVELENASVKEEKGKDYTLGDCGFDPLNLYPSDKTGQFNMQTKEIKNGRLAMMAILGFVVQEALYRQPVIAETPMFFKPAFF